MATLSKALRSITSSSGDCKFLKARIIWTFRVLSLSVNSLPGWVLSYNICTLQTKASITRRKYPFHAETRHLLRKDIWGGFEKVKKRRLPIWLSFRLFSWSVLQKKYKMLEGKMESKNRRLVRRKGKREGNKSYGSETSGGLKGDGYKQKQNQ